MPKIVKWFAHIDVEEMASLEEKQLDRREIK